MVRFADNELKGGMPRIDATGAAAVFDPPPEPGPRDFEVKSPGDDVWNGGGIAESPDADHDLPPFVCQSEVTAKYTPEQRQAIETVAKLTRDELKDQMLGADSFAEMLEKAIRQYQNRSLESAKVIEQLIVLAKEMREAHKRGEALNLSDDEIAFYDALEVNDSAVNVLHITLIETRALRPGVGPFSVGVEPDRNDVRRERALTGVAWTWSPIGSGQLLGELPAGYEHLLA